MIGKRRIHAILSFSMKRILFLTIGLCLFEAMLFTPAAATLQSLQTGMEAPAFSLKTLAGEKKSYADVKGTKLTVLVFWSTWSAKSENVLVRMQKLHEKYNARGLSIIGINADGQYVSDAMPASVKTVSEKLKISFPLLMDPGLVAFNDYGVIALPTTIILDQERVIVYELAGYPLVGAETMADFVTSKIEGRTPPVMVGKSGYQPNKNALRFYNMGKAALRSKSLADSAEQWFKKAVASDPGFVLPHLSLGKMYVQQGEMTLAKSAFREALAREPGNPIALCETGLLLVNEGNGKEGMALLEAARKSVEGYAPCYYYAGYAFGKAGMQEEAAKMFGEAEKVNPRDYHSFVYKGMMYEGRQDRKKAFDAYKKALEIILHLP